MPCTARDATSTAEFGEIPHTKDDTANSARPATYIWRCPTRSAIVPVPRTSAASVSAYASTTHCSDANEACRSTTIRGSAVFTIVTSMSSMKVPRHTVISGSHLRMSSPNSQVVDLRWFPFSLPLPTDSEDGRGALRLYRQVRVLRYDAARRVTWPDVRRVGGTMHMTTTDVVLFLHITVAIAAFGVAAVLLVSMSQMRRAENVSVLRSWARVAHRAEPMFPVLVLFLIVLGAWLIHLSGGEFSWSDGWVITAVVGLVIMEAYGGIVLAPAGKKLHETVEATPDGAVPPNLRAMVLNRLAWAGSYGNTGSRWASSSRCRPNRPVHGRR